VVEPDGGPVTVTAESASGMPVAVRGTSDPTHFALVVTPSNAQRGQMVLTRVTATDADGRSSFADVLVEVPSGAGGEVLPVEVWWVASQGGDPFDAPSSADVTERSVSQTTATGDPGDLVGFAVYASSTPDFEPGPETLVALAPASLRSVVFSRERAAGDTGPVHVKVTARRGEGEGRASVDADSEEPHVPQGVTFRAGKLTVPDVRTNFRPGAMLEVRQTSDGAGERFPVEKAGAKWVVKRRASGTPGGLRLSDVLEPGREVFLVAINPDGRASVVVPFVP
jgi:hypothetical protein